MSIQSLRGRRTVSENQSADLARPLGQAQSFDLRLLGQVNGFFRAITEPAPLIAGAVAGPIFSLVRNPTMSWLLSKPARLLTRGLGLRLLSATAALPGEIAAFGVTQRAVQQIINPNSLDWSREALWHEAGGLALTFGLFKMHGRLAQVLLPKGMQAWGMYSGILHSHLWEEQLGWRKSTGWGDRLTQSLETFVQLRAMGHITHQVMGPRYNAWVASLEARAEEKFHPRSDSLDFSENLALLGPSFRGTKKQDSFNVYMRDDAEPPSSPGPCKVIPIRRDTPTDKAPERPTIVSPPPERVMGQSISEQDIFKLLSLVQSFLPNRGPLGRSFFSEGDAWERMEKLDRTLGSLEPERFDPESLFHSYLEFLRIRTRPAWRESASNFIPYEILLEEVLPIYLNIRRNHLPLAYDELAMPNFPENSHWDSWRATTYLALRLLEGAEPNNQMLYETSEHFLRMVPDEQNPAIMGESMKHLARLRMEHQTQKLETFRAFLFKGESPKPQTLLGIEAFIEFPEDLMGGLLRVARDEKAAGEYTSRVLYILHAAHHIGRN